MRMSFMVWASAAGSFQQGIAGGMNACQFVASTSTLRFALLALLTALLVSLLAGCSGNPPLQNATLAHGPFEIVAKGRRISSGGFPNNSGNPFSTVEVTSFSVRWKGKDVMVPGVGDRFWRVLRLADAPKPALLVGTTDFHLVYEDQGQLVVEDFGDTGGMAEVQWLDAEQGQPGETTMYGLQKASVDEGTDLRGGRWLRLSNATVLDVHTLTGYSVQPWVTPGQAPSGLSAGKDAKAHAFSPGHTQYVTTATDYARTGSTERYEALLVVDIPTGQAYGLKVDHQHMRYVDTQDITPSWIAHYFQWTRDGQGTERLVPRANVKPVAWKGRYSRFSSGTEYRVAPVGAAMDREFQRFLIERMDAKLAPDWLDPLHDQRRTYTVPGCDHVLAVSASDIETRHEVGLYVPTPKQPPWVRCQDTIRRIGEAFDAELAAGRLDKLFVSP
jgi:hypothetical protein